MRQLDLFGSLFDSPTPSPEKKEEKKAAQKKALTTPVKEQTPAEEFKIEQFSVLAEDPVGIIELKETLTDIDEGIKNPIFFTDGKIGVKLKANTAPKAKVSKEEKTITNPLNIPKSVIAKEKKELIKKTPQKRGRKSLKEIDTEADLIDVPEDAELYKKQYYPIRVVAKWFNVNTSLLRFWENEFDILKPRKNKKGDRLFRPEDVKNIQLIYQLLRTRKYTIEGAKEYLKTNKKKAETEMQLIQSLNKFRSFLLDLRANLS